MVVVVWVALGMVAMVVAFGHGVGGGSRHTVVPSDAPFSVSFLTIMDQTVFSTSFFPPFFPLLSADGIGGA